ncbi:MAG: penicillin-insensitive murein endopeptidase [Rhodomicrobium sp.]
MLGFGFILKAVLAVSIMLAALALVGAPDWLAEQETSMPMKPEPALDAAKTEASAAPSPAVTTPEPVVETAPAPFTPSPEISLAQATVVPEASSASAVLKNDLPPPAEEPETAVPDTPPPPQQEMIRLAATAPQIPAPSLAHIPALVIKFAPAKILFGAVNAPSKMATRSIGFYARGCLAGGKPLPVNGPAWQAMRLSRNRMWGHPTLVRYIERFAKDAKAKDGWPGLLVGDMSMPRGGPMPFGHASHQVGLDVDIWYRPMPDRTLTNEERESIPMESFLLDPGHVNPNVWTPDFAKLLRRAVSYPEVARVFVNPAIKKWLCDNVKEDRAFLRKIHPIMGHDDHFHVRLVCPSDNPSCRNQPALTVDEGCGKGLDAWIAKLSKSASASAAAPAQKKPGATPLRASKGKHLITVAQLPRDCRTVLQAPSMAAAR